MGKKPLELDHQVCIIAQVDADDGDSGAFQAADMRVTERQIVAFCAFVHRVAVVQYDDEFPALRAVLQARFGQLQAPVQSIRRVVSPGAGKGPIAAHLAQLAHQAAAGVVAPADAAAGVAHAGALPNAVYPLVVAVADRGGVGSYGGAIPRAGVAVALSQQAVEAVVGQAG